MVSPPCPANPAPGHRRTTSLTVRLRDLLGSFGDEACLGDVLGSGSALRPWVGEPATRFEAFSDDLVWCFAVEHALVAGVVGSIEAAQQLLELDMRVDGDAEYLAADAAVEALDHAIRLR